MAKKTSKNKSRPTAAGTSTRAGTRAGHTHKAKTTAIGARKIASSSTTATSAATAIAAVVGKANALLNSKKKKQKKKRGRPSMASEQAVFVACALSSCGKRANKACKKDRCRGCCVVHKEPCSLHAAEAKELNEIRDMIARGETPRYNMDKLPPALPGMPVRKGYFLEDAFSRFGETVVLFYLGDFLSKKKFCSEALKSAERTRRRSRLNGDQFVQAAVRRDQINQRHKSLSDVFTFLRRREGFVSTDDSEAVVAMMA